MNELLTGASLAVLVVSFGVGIVVGLTGMGGGALMTPGLILLGVPPSAAVANDLVSAALTKSVGAAVHYRSGTTNRQIVGWLIAGSVPTAFAGAFIIKAISGEGVEQGFIRTAIGIALLFTATTYTVRMYVELRRVTSGNARPQGDPPVRPLATLLVGAAGGLLVGLTSVGSGSLIMVALLVLYPALPALRLVGTDLMQAVPLVVAAAVSHVIVSGVDWNVLIPLVIGGVPGTFLGAKLAGWVSQSVIRRGIVMVLTLTGLTLLHVPPGWVGAIGAGMLIFGPVAWGAVRRLHGLPPFDSFAAGTPGRSNGQSPIQPPPSRPPDH